jgi:hypothetical protein
MGAFIKSRKNKKYNYNPRYYDDKGKGNPFEIDSKFAKFRKTYDPENGLKAKASSAFSELRDADPSVNKRLLIIIAILLIVFLYIIDFDLSIFSFNN